MPPGPRKRGPARKKKNKSKASKKSLSSDATRPPHGENDGGQDSSSKSQPNSPQPVVKAEKRENYSSKSQPNSPQQVVKAEKRENNSSKSQHNSPHPVVKTEKREDNSSGNQSLKIERTEEAAKETQSEVEINRGSNSQKSHEKSSSSRSSSSSKSQHNSPHPVVKAEKREDNSSKSQHTSPHPVVKAEKREDNSSGNRSLTIDRTEEGAKETQSEIEINRGSNSHKSHEKSSSSRSSSSSKSQHNSPHPVVKAKKRENNSSKSQHISPHPVVKAEKREDNSSGNQSLTIDRTEEGSKETQSEIEINRGSNSQKSHEKSSSSRSSSSSKSQHNSPHSVVKAEKREDNSSESQHNSPHPVVKAEKREDNSSGNRSLTIDLNEEAAKGTHSEIEIGRGSNSQKSHEKSSSSGSSSSNEKFYVDKKKAAVIEPVDVADLVQPIESLHEKGTCKVGDVAVKGFPIVDPAKPVSSLVELASQVFDNTKLQEKKDLVAAETPLEQNDCPTSTSDVVGSVPKEHGVEKLVSSDDKASPKSNDYLPASTNDARRFCGSNTTDRVNETETPKCSEKQPLLGLAPRPAEKTYWKCCCGIFELFSGSSR